jgi:uncharacterized damage-inducible protein DinB
MYHTIDEFLTDWSYETASTRKILAMLTDASLEQAVDTEGRTIGRLAWHLSMAIPEMMRRTGLEIDAPAEDAPAPADAASIAAAYATAADSMESQLREKWTDASLSVEHDMYGERWTGATTLTVLQRHEAHHRAQLTVLMRQAGLRVPGIYGPSREEWEQMGLPSQK